MSLSLSISAAFAQMPEPGIPQSVGVQLKENNLKPEALDLIKDSGFKVVRRGFLWSNVEKEEGKYDFSRYEALVKNAQERGFTVLGTLALGNDKLYGHVKDPKGREAYARYAAATVAHFKGSGVMWEIWNEPNTKTFWGKHGKEGNTDAYAEEYVNLVNAAVPAMKKADPRCIILGGSVSNLWSASYAWQEFCFKRGILKSGIDYWSLHPYGLKSPEEYLEGYAIVRKAMADAGGPVLPMVDSERGFTVKADKGEGDAGGLAERKAEYQANHFVRQQLIDIMLDMKFTIWYEWSGGEGFALHTEKGEDMPALKAARVMIKTLNGCKFEKRIDLGDPKDFALIFTSKNSQYLVAWTSPGPKMTPDKTVDHEAEIPVTAKGKLATTGIYGDAGQVEVGGGKITLKLTGAPQYVKIK